MANKFDYYNIMGLTPKASPEDIKNAFRKKAKMYHPDINKTSGAEDIFKIINGAYQVLSDPIKREEYDAINREIKEKAERIRRDECIRQEAIRQEAGRIRSDERIRQGTENKIPIPGDIWETLKHNIRPLVILAIIWVIFVVIPISREATTDNIVRYNYAIVQAEPYRAPIPIPTPVTSNNYIFDIDREAGVILYERGDCVITAMVNTGANEESGICAGNDWDSFMKEVKKIKPMVETPKPTPVPTPIPISTTNIDPKANAILANIDPDIREHISSVNIIDKSKIYEICRGGSYFACVNINTIDGKVIAHIYIVDNYDNTCYTFEYALYHEIGHIVTFHSYGVAGVNREDLADNYASQYVYNEC